MQKELLWLKNEKYQGQTPCQFFSDKQRLENGEPLDYIIGTKPFLGTNIDLSYHPFIPRIETEYWIEKILKTLPCFSPLHILDIFSGSGCIGVALARHLPNAHIDCVDNNPNALKQIQKNATLHNLNKQITIIKSNVFSNITQQYDYIFANPPYLSRSSQTIQTSVVQHEPHDALFADNNGMYYIEQIIQKAHQHLRKNGVLYIEHDPEQTQSIHAKAKGFTPQTYTDQYGLKRVTKLST